MKHQLNGINLLLIIIVGILISCLSYFYVFEAYAFNDQFYIKHFESLEVNKIVGISTADLEQVTRELIHYIDTGSGNIHVTATIGGSDIEYFNVKEQAHLNDIKVLIRKARAIRDQLLWATILLTALLIFSLRKNRIQLSKVLLSTVISSFTTLLVLGILYLSDFDAAFRKFHELLFYNDLWLLNPAKDRLLQMMPLEFFMIFTLYCIGTLFLIHSVFLILYFFIRNRSKRKKRMFI